MCPAWQNLPVTPDDPVLAAFRRAAADREHGAAEIEAGLAAELLALRPQWAPEALAAGGALLAAGQPAMANLRALAAAAAAGEPEAFGERLEARAAALAALQQRLADAAWGTVAGAARLVTLSRSSAVAAVVVGARGRGWRGTVVVLDGSEGGRGRDQAAALAVSGPTLSQPDATAPRWLEGAAVVVAVGADAVGGQRFVNCVGTRALLELAAARRLPRLLVADRGKDVAEAAIDELVARAPTRREAAGREWPIFEAVPSLLITARISEGKLEF
jgi:translation initiation factor 2B subunit (eIF-2B alpha/beta/delta family)